MTEPAPGRELIRLGAPDDAEMDRLVRLSANVAESGRFPDARKPAEAFAKLIIGRDLGLTISQSLTGVDIVEGKPRLSSTTLAGFVKASPLYDYRVLELDATHCKGEFGPYPAPGKDTEGKWLPWPESFGEIEFTIEQAKTAGLVKDKSGWTKWPEDMLFARFISKGVRRYCPDLFGGIPVYTEADEFEVRPTLTTGSGSGEAQNIQLPESVEAVLARAAELGHAGYDRATVEMALTGQDEKAIGEWVAKANEELDAFVPEADVIDVKAEARGKREAADKLDAMAAALGEKPEANAMFLQAQALREEAEDLEGSG